MVLSFVNLTSFLLSVFISSLWQLQRGDEHQPSAIPDTPAPPMGSDLPRTALHEQLPVEAFSKLDASKQPDSQPAMSGSEDQPEQPSLAASQQQEELPLPAAQQECAAVESSPKGADPGCGSRGLNLPEHDSAVQSCVLRGPARHASSEQRLAQRLSKQSSKESVAGKTDVPANHKHKPSELCTAAEATPEQAEVGSVQTQHPRSTKGLQQAESEAQAAATAVLPSIMKLRTGLRPRPDSAANVDKCGVASQVRAESARKKQVGADFTRNFPEAKVGSSRVGRGRAYGRGGRRGRSRSNLFRSSHFGPQPAGTTLSSAHHHLISCTLICYSSQWKALCSWVLLPKLCNCCLQHCLECSRITAECA